MASDVIIVGGGVAGVSCAVALADRGLRVTLLEREAHLGGRAASEVDPATGDPVHLGPHVLASDYLNFRALLDRVRSPDPICWQEPGMLYTVLDGTRASRLRGPAWLPPPLPFFVALLRDRGLSTRDVLSHVRTARLALGLDERAVLALDAYDGAQILRAIGVTPRMRARVWALASITLLNVPLERASAGTLLRTLGQIASRERAALGFPRRGLGDLFAPGAARLVGARGEVWRGARVEALLRDEAGAACGVRLADGRLLHARHVVAALPPADLARILPDDVRRTPWGRGLDWFEPVPCVSVYLWFDRRITRRAFWTRPESATGLNVDFYDHANIYAAPPRGSLVGSNIIHAERVRGWSDEQIVRATLAELRENIVGARTANVVATRVHRVPLAVLAPRPGFEHRRPPAETPVAGLTIAGDWTRTGLPSSMESAAASGHVAAEHVLAAMGHAAALRIPLAPPGLLVRALGAPPRARCATSSAPIGCAGSLATASSPSACAAPWRPRGAPRTGRSRSPACGW